MLVIPVNTTHQPVTRTRPVSWKDLTKRVGDDMANDNPAMAITRQVPAEQFKGQFLDLLS